MSGYRSRCLYLILFCTCILFPIGLLKGWGFETHKAINRKAVKFLPGPLGSNFSQNVDYISEHSIDPDLWKEKDPDEGYGHYMDCDLYGDYPFSDIPRSLDLLIESYGADKVKKWGIAPWRIKEYYHRLIENFKAGHWEEANLTAAALAHYISDIHMPLHVVANYDGQLTGNDGVHGQWETQMVDRYLLDNIHPKGILFTVRDPVEESFTVMKESYLHHFDILRADFLARKNLSEEEKERLKDWRDPMADTKYHEILFRESGNIAKERIEMAVLRVASFWYTAWIKAGKPMPEETSVETELDEKGYMVSP